MAFHAETMPAGSTIQGKDIFILEALVNAADSSMRCLDDAV